eukprot:48194-Eustigmatos_ZCMA.PRE.1
MLVADAGGYDDDGDVDGEGDEDDDNEADALRVMVVRRPVYSIHTRPLFRVMQATDTTVHAE